MMEKGKPLNANPIQLSDRDKARFWSKVQKSDTCWLWTDAATHKGYGRFFVVVEKRQVSLRAHRVAWGLLNGQIPDGLTVDHLCRNRLCVNPDHLEPVTMRENTLRGEGLTARQARQTHCAVTSSPKPTPSKVRKGRMCRQCATDTHRRQWEQKKGRKP